MSRWLRIFGLSDRPPDPVALREMVEATAPGSVIQLTEGDRGWRMAEIMLPGGKTPLRVERFRRDEEGIREELQTWAAWLETCDYSEHHQRLMQHMISTQQVFTINRPSNYSDEVTLDEVCVSICRSLAQATDGVYQVDEQGFYNADGTLLVQEY